MSANRAPPPCPCGSGASYARCCGPLHLGGSADSAVALMRSRYSAYALGLHAYVLATWHPSTRPASLAPAPPEPTPAWLGLDVRAWRDDDATHATVEFIARYRVGGGRAQRLHETSRFVREDGRWYYVDGDVAP